MPSISHIQWSCLNQLSLQAHSTEDENQLIHLVVLDIPRALDIDCSAWRKLGEANSPSVESYHVPTDYLDKLNCTDGESAASFHPNPVISRLGIASDLVFPGKRICSLEVSLLFGQPTGTLEIEESSPGPDHANGSSSNMIQLLEGNVFTCQQTATELNAEQEFSLRVLRDHFSIAFSRKETILGAHPVTLPPLNYDILTRREREILPFVLQGKSNSEISIILSISGRTVEKHVSSIIGKMGVENRKVLISETSFGIIRNC